MLTSVALIALGLARTCEAVVRQTRGSFAPQSEALYVWSDGSDGNPEGLVRVDAASFPPRPEEQRRLAQQRRQTWSSAGAASESGSDQGRAATDEELIYWEENVEDMFEAEETKPHGSTQEWKKWQRKTQLVMPQHKLGFCYIPKVGSAQMTRLFNELNGVSDGWQSSTPAKLGVKWTNVTSDSGWMFAFFTRDPLSRYLSAFGSKCMVNTAGVVEGQPPGVDCKGKILWKPVPLAVALETFEERVFNDSKAREPADNPHWWSMMKIIDLCGNRFDPYTVDFKGDLDGDAHEEVQKMLTMVDVPNAAAVAEKYFPKNQVAGHSSRTEARLQQFYRSRAVVQAVANIYATDYVRLRLPLPEKGHPWMSTYRPAGDSVWDKSEGA